MRKGPASRRRASSAIRTLVVASATLAILLVCFSIYQYSQVGPTTPNTRDRRVPTMPQRPASGDSMAQRDGSKLDTSGVSIGPATISQGQKMKLSVFPREGTRSVLEIAVRDYTPLPESPHEFHLSEPEIRLRTNEGRTVRVRAREGTLDAQRMGAGGLDPRRGRLKGDVMIEIDRMTSDEWAALSADARKRLIETKMNIVTVRVDEIDFDLEYSKVLVPRGSLSVTAHDIDFHAEDLELRFDEDQGRIEYMRIDHGGRLALRELNDDLGLAIPQTDAEPEKSFSIPQWIRQTFTTVLQANNLATKSMKPETVKALAEAKSPEDEADDIPVFRPDTDEDKKAKLPVRYLARFEGGVDAQQVVDATVQARLQSDVLEILRALTQEDRARVQTQLPDAKVGPKPSWEPQRPREEIRLAWTGKLVLEALNESHEQWTEDEVSRVTASGQPVRLTSPQWKARCAELKFDPNQSEVLLTGSTENPVVVFSPEQGSMVGRTLFTQRSGDELVTKVTGPGALYRLSAEAFDAVDADPATLGEPSVTFADRMELNGRFENRTSIKWSEGRISTREERVIKQADFYGSVRMVEGDTHLSADEVAVRFQEPTGRNSDRAVADQILGNGSVVMTQGSDRVTCGEIDVRLTTDRDGKPVPVSATATNVVEAIQKERTLRARDKLVVTFVTVSKPPPPFDPIKAHAKAVEAGKDVTKIDWADVRRRHESTVDTEVGISRLVADGEVVVVDPDGGLDVRARHVDCALAKGREITEVLLVGDDEKPASAELSNFSVTGQEVKLNVPDEWASVPGAGRMTFNSFKDLDGRQANQPIPISVTWLEHMKYEGRENRARFVGGVHATSASSTTFDCARLVVEFEEKVAGVEPQNAREDWWIFDDLVDTVSGRQKKDGLSLSANRFSKEPVNIIAFGNARMETLVLDDSTGARKGRALLIGPRLSVNLRPEVSKMLIEGEGKLLLEDFREASGKADHTASPKGQSLLSMDQDAGPSKTLISWKEYMWYDFSIDQTRFEGDVDLKHFSGAVLDKWFSSDQAVATSTAPPGRETYLSCDVLTVDFLDRHERRRQPQERRMGGLSAERLRQFQATGSVQLQDETEKLSLLADRVVFERDREILAIYGTQTRPAQILQRRKGQARGTIKVERAFYNLATGVLEGSNVSGGVWGQ